MNCNLNNLRGRAASVCLLIGIALIGCDSQRATEVGMDPQVRSEVSLDPELFNVLREYYRAEEAQDWEKTYSYRSDSFRRVVPFETYARQMNEDSAGWKLLRIQIVNSVVEGNRVSLRMRFTEEFNELVAKKFFGGRVDAGENTWEDVGVWHKAGNRWICDDAVSRNHMALNGALTN